MNITKETRIAYAETNEIINLLEEADRNKIPLKLRKFFEREKDKDYKNHIDIEKPLKDQNLTRKTLALIAMLNLNYICEDENEKKRLRVIYKANEEKYKEEMRKKYSSEGMFGKVEKETVFLVEPKNETFFKKIINKIKKFFHIV